MPNGALAVSGKEGGLRQKLIEDDLVDVIISCPETFITSHSRILVVFGKNSQEIVFANALAKHFY